uniref:START domain-containing protein n=1 Tax=Sinocyclocheilus rhinocerous TaxID=307959 RepID=A0A673LLS6_9TELE
MKVICFLSLPADSQFPIEISDVKRDHDFLDKDLVEPLCRLGTLKHSKNMSTNFNPVLFWCMQSEDSDEEDLLAISNRWTFEWNSRCWSRLQDIDYLLGRAEERSPSEGGEGLRTTVSSESFLTDLSEPEICSLHSEDSLAAMSGSASLTPLHLPRELPHYGSLPAKSRRRGRTRAKDFLRRMETLGRTWGPSMDRSERRSLVISGPVLQSEPEALKTLRCVQIFNGGPLNAENMPPANNCPNSLASSEASSQSETSGSAESTPNMKGRVSKLYPPGKRAGIYLEDIDVLTGAPQRTRPVERSRKNEFRSYDELLVHIPKDHKPGTFPKALSIESLTPASKEHGKVLDSEPKPFKCRKVGGRELRPSLIQNLMKETKDKTKGWVTRSNVDNTEISLKKVGDGTPLRRWRVSVEVEAPPSVVLNRILRERHLWDSNLLQWKVLETLDKQTEVYQYELNSMAPHPNRDFVVLRTWRTEMPKGVCVLVSVSIDHEESPQLAGVRGIILESQYLLEPCGSGKSRLTHICRADLKGKSPEWYNKAFGHLCASEAARIRNSFLSLDPEGPETKI